MMNKKILSALLLIGTPCLMAQNVFLEREVLCSLPREPGPCRGKYHRFYYDYKSASCRRFIFGGCQGNANNFDDQAACIRTCHGSSSSDQQDSNAVAPVFETTSAPWRQHLTSAPNYLTFLSDICKQPLDEGEGEQFLISRYFYNVDSGSCQEFLWSGSGGNENRFETLIDCYQSCFPNGNWPNPIRGQRRTRKPETTTMKPNFTPDWVIEEFVPIESFTTEPPSTTLLPTSTIVITESTSTEPPTTTSTLTTPTTLAQDFPTTTTPKVISLLFAKQVNNIIEQNFDGEDYFETTTTAPTTSLIQNDITFPSTTTRRIENRCYETLQKGVFCDEGQSSLRFYFEPSFRVCRIFRYSGCGGNRNRFDTLAQCREACEQPIERFSTLFVPQWDYTFVWSPARSTPTTTTLMIPSTKSEGNSRMLGHSDYRSVLSQAGGNPNRVMSIFQPVFAHCRAEHVLTTRQNVTFYACRNECKFDMDTSCRGFTYNVLTFQCKLMDRPCDRMERRAEGQSGAQGRDGGLKDSGEFYYAKLYFATL